MIVVRFHVAAPGNGVVSLVVKPRVVIPLSRVRFSYDSPKSKVNIVYKEYTMTEEQLIEFLTNNLSLQVSNNPDPYFFNDVFTVSLVLNDKVISQVVLNVNDGIA